MLPSLDGSKYLTHSFLELHSVYLQHSKSHRAKGEDSQGRK